MKKIYVTNSVTAERFTENYIPFCVIVANNELIERILIPSLQQKAKKNGVYIFKIPQPNGIDKKAAKILNAPFPFTWIKHGDYILTNSAGYSWVESKDVFERDYY